ncbi:MAG: sugar phosphate nucleotidyltransferase, partial [Candidatus Pacearchaeota archaeon]|nr:sugar phosphate nucleotidyltransferase [Candidatus Pacearchaeota archaeon]
LRDSGISEVVIVTSPTHRKVVADYLKGNLKLEKLLRDAKKEDLALRLSALRELVSDLSITVITDRPLGHGHAVLQAKRYIGEEPCVVLYPDDVIYGTTPITEQMIKVFRTAQSSVAALSRLPDKEVSAKGAVSGERISSRLLKIEKIVEKPAPGTAPSSLVSVGWHLVTPDIFSYLRKLRPGKNGELIFFEALADMVQDGKVVYGYEIEGTWLDCGSVEGWMKANAYLTFKDKGLARETKEFLKQEGLL